MTEPSMTGAGCASCRDLAPELAMGLVTGRERATAVAHLQECADCRRHLASLTRLHDEVRSMVPPVDPPVGFEARVLARIGRRRSARRWPWIAAAAAVVVAAFLAGAAVAARTAAPAPAPLAAGVQTVLAAPLVAGGRDVGHVYVHENRSWLYMYLEDAPDTGPLRCAVLRRDGSVADTAPLRLVDGDAVWGGPIPAEGTVPAAVQVTDAAGTVVAIAQLPEAGPR